MPVYHLHVDQLRQAVVGLGHERQIRGRAVAFEDPGGPRHVHPGAAVDGQDVGAGLLQHLGRLLHPDPHHGAHVLAVAVQVERHGGNDAGGAGFPGGGDTQADLLQRRLGLDDHRVGPGAHQGRRLLTEGGHHGFLRYLAIGLHQAAERSHVTDYVARAAGERGARERYPARVDLLHAVGQRVTFEHDAAGAEGVSQQAVRSRFDVTAVDGLKRKSGSADTAK